MKFLLAEQVRMTFMEAVEYAKAREIVSETHDSDSYTVAFSDGSSMTARSEYEGPWSEVTPGDGIQLPTFLLTKAVKS